MDVATSGTVTTALVTHSMENSDIIEIEDGWEKIMKYLARMEVIVEDSRLRNRGVQ